MNYENIEVIQLTAQLVEIESTNVGTFEGEVSKFVYDWLKSCTEAEVVRDEYAPGRYNVIATLKGKVSHPNLIYIAHMDTVPAGAGWSKEPFKAEFDGNKLYGRGACDMKAGVASAMIAFRDFENRCRKEGITPKYDFVFIASGDEEDAMTGVDRIVDMGIADKDSLVLDTEPTMSGERIQGKIPSGPVIVADHKGKTWFEITTHGVPCHGSNPTGGVDAIIAMSEVVLEIRNQLAKYPIDPVMGGSTVCFGTIKGGFNTNIVADKCTITLDMRLSPPLTNEGSIKLVEDAIAAAAERVPGASGEYRVIAMRPYVERDDNSYLMSELKKACKEAIGKDAEVVFFTGYTDSGVIDSRTHCHNAMSFGPDGDQAHQADEYVLCDTVVENLKVISNLAERILL